MLNITVAHETARVPIAVVSLEGELDGATYLDAIGTMRELVNAGTTHVLLDLEKLTYLGSSGIFMLHSAAMLLRGQELPDPEGGWAAIHAAANAAGDTGDHVKLLSPQPQVDRVLERSGMKRFFETYTDRSAALASF